MPERPYLIEACNLTVGWSWQPVQPSRAGDDATSAASTGGKLGKHLVVPAVLLYRWLRNRAAEGRMRRGKEKKLERKAVGGEAFPNRRLE